MNALIRLGAVGIAGGTLYCAGVLNSLVVLEPSRAGATLVVAAIAGALTLLAMSLVGTGAGDAAVVRPALRWPVRAAWAIVSVCAVVSVSWIFSVAAERSPDWTPHHNDAIALNECAARLVLEGRNPYTDLDLLACYGSLGIGADRTTPLQRGLFRDVSPYPSDEALDAAWAIAQERGAATGEFVSRPSYPALSFVLLVPFIWLGWDTNLLYVACLLAAVALVVARAERSLRPYVLTALLGATSLAAFTVGGSADLLYALPLVAAWLWRERAWSTALFGLAIATKQIAWFFAPFFLLRVWVEHGPAEAGRRAAAAVGILLATNLPFIALDVRAWAAGVLTPISEPMFPRGSGLVLLSTSDVIPLFASSTYLALEVAAGTLAFALAWRARRSSPEIGAVLALLPLFFAWRSLFSYFFLLPLFAMAGIVRMPLGPLGPAAARAAGALTPFAAPATRRGSAEAG